MHISPKRMHLTTKKGFTLLFGVLITGLLLSMVLTIAGIVVRQLIISGIGRESQIAFYAADSGLECVRYYDRDNNFNYLLPADQIPNPLNCNGQGFVRDSVTTVTCALGNPGDSNDAFCPENIDLEDQGAAPVSYRKIVYRSHALTATANPPEADFVILKRSTDNRSTVTVSGRNTSNLESGRRVERTLKETYLPSFQCAPDAALQPPLTPEPDDIVIEARRVSCRSEEYLPDISNSFDNGVFDSNGFNMPMTEDQVDTFITNSGGNCTYHGDACFEYSLEILPEGDEPDTGDFFQLGYTIPGTHPGSANDLDPNDLWEPFESASTLNQPAIARIRVPDDSTYISKLRVRTLLQPQEFPFFDPNDAGVNQHWYGNNPATPFGSNEFICHKDGVNYDNMEYLGENNSNIFHPPPPGATYFCVAFTTRNEVSND